MPQACAAEAGYAAGSIKGIRDGDRTLSNCTGKALVDKITPTLDRLTSAVERIPTAVAEALRDHERTKDHVER